MNNRAKKILRNLLWFGILIGLFVLTSFINHNMKEEKCKEVMIQITDAKSYGFIDEGDVTSILNRDFNTPVSQKIKDIDTYSIEKALNEHQAIANAEVYITIDGKLNIVLEQRKPILRVFSSKGSFYIDSEGKIMPVSNKYTAHVPVASGNIDLSFNALSQQVNVQDDDLDSSLIPDLYFDLKKLAQFIDSKPFWKAQIEQLYVDKEYEFELIPRVGNHTIVLGEVYNLDSKFEKLMLFYREGLSKTGWNEYKTINLKFKDQVVCTKRY